MSQFQGYWKLDKSDNFDEYMKEVQVALMTRKIASTLKPDLDIKIEGNKWTLHSESTFKNHTLVFTLDEEFEETTPDGRKLRSKVSLVDGKIVHIQKAIKADDRDSVITRWVDGDRMFVTLVSGSVTAHREYARSHK
ncbi:hypothetical protein WR25_21450 [Diploscapter pachys]|uniref:Cytosolic fatty-acid binding proteins domain-containing protein n=1 Tax=Diploscapter pachys TaxID=2018661 RepID=A0A2A2JEU7_9BILA|nr:hypothetical protein WR25_21450 [Diploscapter pachys]